MDRLGGIFGSHDNADDHDDYDDSEFGDDLGAPQSPVGQDERRMQVRAYNHWASLLDDRHFPAIGDLNPAGLDDFGPYSVLLDFSGGIEDPRILFLGRELAGECDAQGRIARLSDVPSRSLLSRITDHYMQILANQAPIGFEAEFVNQRGHTVLYRGILLPYSSNDETIDFIYGVINWKELADSETADELLLEIDQALERDTAAENAAHEESVLDLAGDWADAHDDVLDLGMAAAFEPQADLREPVGDEGFSATDSQEIDWDAADSPLSRKGGDRISHAFGSDAFGDEEEDEPDYSVDYGEQGLEDEEESDDVDGVVDPLADESVGSGLVSLVSRGSRRKPLVELPTLSPDDQESVPEDASGIPQPYEHPGPAPSFVRAPVTLSPEAEDAGDANDADADDEIDAPVKAHIPETDAEGPSFVTDSDEPLDDGHGQYMGPDAPDTPSGDETAEPVLSEAAAFEAAFAEDEREEAEPESETAIGPDATSPDASDDGAEGLYDTLAEAREMAQAARSSEDRTRSALYRAVGRAYDFSLEAADNPDEFAELVADNGLSVQERAPMTPVVKLVFGSDYDKTRVTEYAAVLSHAHRIGVERGQLADVLSQADGGLRGVVEAERRARKEEAGKPVETADGIKLAMAKKLRALEPLAFEDLDGEGPEFALVMVRRSPTGELVVLGEVPEDVRLVERAGRKLVA